MILKTVDIETFAGLSGVRVDFAPGTNIILGANEAGKSTLYHAIRSVLTQPAKQSKPQFSQNIARFLPVSGGDSVRASIEFLYRDEPYRIERRWGNDPGSVLRLPSGAILTNDDEVQGALWGMMPAPRSTVLQVFLAAQSDLADSVSRIVASGEVFSSLSDSLRKSILESGGVSVEGFRRSLEDAVSGAFGRWDRERGMPEKGRGADNQWTKGVGTILAAWYRTETIRKNLEVLRAGEEEIARLTEEASEAVKEIDDLERFLSANREIAKTAGRGELLERKCDDSRRKLEKYRNDYDTWPRLEEKRNELAAGVAELEKTIPELEARRDAAKTAAGLREQAQRVARIDTLRRERKTIEADEALAAPVTAPVLGELRRLQNELGRVHAALASGELTITLRATRATEVHLAKGSEQPDHISLGAGDTTSRSISGAAHIMHDGLELRVQSGNTDPEALAERAESLDAELRKSLSEVGVADVESASKQNAEFERVSARLSAVDEQIDRELAGRTYEELVGDLSGLPDTETDLESAATAVAEARSRMAVEAERLRSVQDTLRGLEANYTNRDRLFGLMTDTATELRGIEAEAAALPGLPDEYTSASAFLAAYDSKRNRLEQLREARHRITVRILEAGRGLPEESSEELERELASAKHEYESALSYGNSLERIARRTEELLRAPDTGLFRDIEKHFSACLGAVTGNRYTGPESWDGVPGDLRREDGLRIGFELLSGGTKDLFSLCLRLSLARHYTSAATGFMLLDDPLVELDPNRRKAAAELLAQNNEALQMVVLTCHPDHAGLYPGANLIEFK